jgi:predicted sulfurtransferase
MDNFRDLPNVVKQIAHLKNKTVVTVCTGGVRCEKASGYLITQGFTDVYQLENGIVTYMEKYPNENFLGKLYVFDKRILMGFYTDDTKHVIVGRCEGCDAPCERFVKGVQQKQGRINVLVRVLFLDIIRKFDLHFGKKCVDCLENKISSSNMKDLFFY